jgi:SAM-dependent MidA family methyltransferase
MPIAPDYDDDARRHSARVAQLIRAEITAAGRLPFDRFMDLALYAPGLGYYVAGAIKLGAAGDFVTAPEISPLFGRCVAAQCAQVLAVLGGGDVLELGAGSGALAADLLAALAALGAVPERYWILEPSPELAARQRALLAERVPALAERVCWISSPPAGLRGVVLANEVLDALPVHRFRIDADGAVQEVFVIADGGRFAAATEQPVSAGLADAVTALQGQGLARSPGYCSEINLRAAPWLRLMSESLAAGMLLLIDYGYPAHEYYLPERSDGTLMCHFRHQACADPFERVGLQDITAHVDFSAIARAGIQAGLTLSGYTTQANFLLGCGLDGLMAAAAGDPGDMLALTAGVKQLVLPSAMGERFQAIAFTRAVEPPAGGAWCGFSLRDLRERL